ncbi:nuclear transport factor 2 family protein [Acidipila rosea]|uniref:Putative SnoaL-like aldol condensation-catalyzing enzyme n=1 Tax=Acidipila rosea TaxID=768535 RepID=A0A4R1L443_9BACT|nr:nuclear transport factor 2 family protein [Acidipila rosea]MBW4026202.1 SnoaL-like domain-containing protein [Acidobacteriota bacterium]MBW4044662.1 SnoaL-like domain-containing protein [Acidobacteriota bacterium]TCK72835.1 putative SnoaL-like aldol condensation-catalyzing enzyme [Acidipila rosea]
MSIRKHQVVDLLKSIQTGDTAPLSYINPNKYIQHNHRAADGLAGFGALIASLPAGSAKVFTPRVFEDGEFVFSHTEYDFFGPKIGFDIFRFEDGSIVEHWDNLQERPTGANPSGHTMTDGPAVATDLNKTLANKILVEAFVEDVLVNGRMQRLGDYIAGDNYVQHNPYIGDGLSGLGKALEAMAREGITLKYDTIHRILGEGSFVLSVSEGEFGGKHVSFYDLFRVVENRIVEHWDTIEEIPAFGAEWKNGNGKF